MQSKRPSSRSLENHEGPNRRRCCEDPRRTGRRIRTYECHSEFFSWARQVRTCCHPAHELPRSVSSSCQFSSMISLSWEALELAPIGEYRMCQGADRRLCNLSQRCHVRKVARLLARPLNL